MKTPFVFGKLDNYFQPVTFCNHFTSFFLERIQIVARSCSQDLLGWLITIIFVVEV